jgi:hypothetical protein
LRLSDRLGDLERGRLIGLAGAEEKLEKHRALELLEGVRDLVPRASGGIPLGDDHRGVGNADAQRRIADLSFPDHIARFHRYTSHRISSSGPPERLFLRYRSENPKASM